MIDVAVRAGLGILAPAAIATGAVLLLLHRGLKAAADGPLHARHGRRRRVFRGLRAAVARARLRPVVPASRWQWLPYIGLMAAVVGSLHPQRRMLWGHWCAAVRRPRPWWPVKSSCPAAKLLGLPRLASVVVLAGLMLGLAVLLEMLPDRLCGRGIPRGCWPSWPPH